LGLLQITHGFRIAICRVIVIIIIIIFSITLIRIAIMLFHPLAALGILSRKLAQMIHILCCGLGKIPPRIGMFPSKIFESAHA
jgi:hypothetical protein